MTPDTAELRRLAEAATAANPEPWHSERSVRAGLSLAADVSFVAAVNPTVVLGLLDRIEALEGALRGTTLVFHSMAWHDHHGWTSENCPIERCRQNAALLEKP